MKIFGFILAVLQLIVSAVNLFNGNIEMATFFLVGFLTTVYLEREAAK